MIVQIKDFFKQLQPQDDMFDYILDYFSSCLVGHSPDELFHIWTGSGGNGKSLSIGLFQSVVGSYATTISITLLTNKFVIVRILNVSTFHSVFTYLNKMIMSHFHCIIFI